MTANQDPVVVIGMGLAGSECAYQLAKRGLPVTLVDMRPEKKSPAHSSAKPAELVCSNSLRSNDVHNAVGLIKEEMASLDSLIIRSAYKARVPAGSALAVDRDVFSDAVAAGLQKIGNVSFASGEVAAIEGAPGENLRAVFADGRELKARAIVMATGPLTSDALSTWIKAQTGQDSLYFYDSIAPIVDADSIDMNVAFRASRYEVGEESSGDYINCPMTRAQYDAFIDAVLAAELAPVHDFDKAQFFEGCLPIEEMVRRGRETLAFGPMKLVGLRDPRRPDEQFGAVVQLRQDDTHASLYNMVGFQTRMKYGEQQRIFKAIPGLENAEFVRMGSMHRNTYLCSPVVLGEGMTLKSRPGVHFAGQITGCEGYVESSAVGLFVGMFLAKKLNDKVILPTPPATTALGALLHHILAANPNEFQPMNVNFGLFSPLEERRRKIDKKLALVKRAIFDIRQWHYDHDL